MPPKRVASSELDEERERLVDRRTKWAAIENLTRQAKSVYDAYILSGDGEIGRPRDVVEDKDIWLLRFDIGRLCTHRHNLLPHTGNTKNFRCFLNREIAPDEPVRGCALYWRGHCFRSRYAIWRAVIRLDCIALIAAGLVYTLDVNPSTGKWIGYQILDGVGHRGAFQVPMIIVHACQGLIYRIRSVSGIIAQWRR